MTDTATRAGQPAAPGQPPPSAPPDGVGDGRWFIAMFLGAAALVALLFFGFIAVALAISDPATPAAATTVDVTLSEFAVEGALTAPAGDVNLNITNIGSATHNLVVRDLALTSGDISSGGNASLALGRLAAGTYQVFCSIPGHEASGMVADLVVTAGGAADAGHGANPASGAGATAGHDGTTAEEYAKMDADMMASIAAFPAETQGKGNAILAPTEVEADGTKVF
ncbi:MAG: cupredoxin domain-containing protein, partial [Acidimicrobiia bacterium]|nr:cupredoxin domain-containing protein [Acidimicrobiia bacterium]